MKDATRQLKLNKFYVKVDLRDEFDSKIEDIEFDKKKIEKIKRLLKHQTIKYGTIETRALIEKPSRIILNKRYGMNWIEKTHPSLHK